MNNRTFKLINGYLPADIPDQTAKQLGLLKRFAWVIDTYRPDLGPNMYFDYELLLALLNRFLLTFPFNKIEMTVSDGKKQAFNYFLQLSDYYSGSNKAPSFEPFKDLKIFDKSAVVCFIRTEFWSRVGGPQPYNDSYTFSVYTYDYDPKVIFAISEKTALDLSAVLEETITGKEKSLAKPPGLLRRFVKFLLGF